VSLVEQLDWDSLFFGLPIGRVAGTATAEDISAAVHEALDRELDCIYLLASADDDTLIESAQEHGFTVREIRVELERLVRGHALGIEGLRIGLPEDLSRFEQVARERFRTTRFFADKRFPPDRSEALYVEWLRRGLNDRAQRRVLVTADASGFVVCHLDIDSQLGRIELIGVAANASRRGLGNALMAGAGTLFKEASLNTAMVVTQGHNVPAQRLYQSHGYRTTKTSLWLHRWLSPA
jgi:dTDP-4-amino-4,6-dideoxy-D-galactose acyltransferase